MPDMIPNLEAEIRTLPLQDVEFRCIDNDIEGLKLEGYAVVWEDRAVLADFGDYRLEEQFERDCEFVPMEGRDIYSYYQHNLQQPVARTNNGSLQLRKDSKGLKCTIKPVDSSYTRDMMQCIEAGLVDGMSVIMRVKKDTVEEDEDKGYVLRRIQRAELIATDIVSRPAYNDTTIAKRSFDAFLEEKRSAQSEVAPEEPESEMVEEEATNTPPMPGLDFYETKRRAMQLSMMKEAK